MNISVAMATYNGEKYIIQQIKSILEQLDKNDELIIIDDKSSDRTVNLIEYHFNDSRVKLMVNNTNIGIIKNFEKALKKCSKQFIILADQDDVWKDNKVDVIKNVFKTNPNSLLMSNATVTDDKLVNIPNSKEESSFRKGYFQNLFRNTYRGCTMAFSRDLLKYILPIPKTVPMHDVWIGLISELIGYNIVYIEQDLIFYRRHTQTNTSPKRRRTVKVIFSRFTLFCTTIFRYLKIIFSRK